MLFFLYIFTHFEFHSETLKKIPSNHEHLEVRGKEKASQNREPGGKLIKQADPPLEQEHNKDNEKQKQEAIFIRKLAQKSLKFKGPTNERQKSVVEAFVHAWKAYKAYAWGQDELKPISKTSSTWFNLGLTIVDSLDTIYLMNLKEIFAEASDWIKNSMSLDSDRFNNLFEITIRVLGGLLSAYHLSGENFFLDKAYDLGNRSLPAFDTKSNIPLSDINLQRRQAKPPSWSTDSSTAEVASLQIEFKELGYLTKDDRFIDVANKVSEHLHYLNKEDGLVPIYINPYSGNFVGHTITLGARGDSYYEYLLKQWIQNGAKFDAADDKQHFLIEDWLQSVKGIKERLIKKTQPNNLTFVGEMISGSFSPKMDHLVCFLPGNLALGAMHLKMSSNFPKSEVEDLMRLARVRNAKKII